MKRAFVAMRTYFYRLTARGELLHEGITVDDEQFRDIFFGNLQPNTTGLHPDYPYCSPCGAEMNFLLPEDTPYVFTRFDGERLYFAPRRSVQFDPEQLVFDAGVLYHRAPHQQWGRLSLAVLMELAPLLSPWGDWYAIVWKGTLSVIPPRQIPEHLHLIRPRAGNMCAGCGRDNPSSLQITALFDAATLQADSWLPVPVHTSGSLGIMHGGFVALVLDEIMGKVLSGMGIKAPTAELTIRYQAPVRIGSWIQLHAEYLRSERRAHHVRGEVRDGATRAVLASGSAVFVVPRGTMQ